MLHKVTCQSYCYTVLYTEFFNTVKAMAVFHLRIISVLGTFQVIVIHFKKYNIQKCHSKDIIINNYLPAIIGYQYKLVFFLIILYQVYNAEFSSFCWSSLHKWITNLAIKDHIIALFVIETHHGYLNRIGFHKMIGKVRYFKASSSHKLTCYPSAVS